MENAMAENDFRPQEAKIAQVFNGRDLALAQHLVELDQVHGCVKLNAHAELLCSSLGGLEQLGGAGVELGGVEHAADSVVEGAVVLADEVLGLLQASHAGRLVPLPVDAAVAIQHIASAAVLRAEICPHA